MNTEAASAEPERPKVKGLGSHLVSPTTITLMSLPMIPTLKTEKRVLKRKYETNEHRNKQNNRAGAVFLLAVAGAFVAAAQTPLTTPISKRKRLFLTREVVIINRRGLKPTETRRATQN
jgi:hypothetical protein